MLLLIHFILVIFTQFQYKCTDNEFIKCIVMCHVYLQKSLVRVYVF